MDTGGGRYQAYPAAVARDWVDNGYHDDLWEYARKFIIRCAPNGARLLEIGFGSAYDLARLAGHFDCTGIDASPDMVELASAQHPGLRLLLGDVLHQGQLGLGQFDEDEFGVCFSAATWLHFRKRYVPRGLVNLRRVLQNGSIVFLSFKKGKGEGWRTEYSTSGVKYVRWFSFWTLEEITPVLAAHGFHLVDHREPDDPKHADLTWLELYLQLDK